MLPIVRQSVLSIYYADLLGQMRGKYLKKLILVLKKINKPAKHRISGCKRTIAECNSQSGTRLGFTGKSERKRWYRRKKEWRRRRGDRACTAEVPSAVLSRLACCHFWQPRANIPLPSPLPSKKPTTPLLSRLAQASTAAQLSDRAYRGFRGGRLEY